MSITGNSPASVLSRSYSFTSSCVRWFFVGTLVGFTFIALCGAILWPFSGEVDFHLLREDPVAEVRHGKRFGHRFWSEIHYRDGRVEAIYDLYYPFRGIHPAEVATVLILMSGMTFGLGRWCYLRYRVRLASYAN